MNTDGTKCLVYRLETFVKKKVKNINNQKVKCMFYKNSVIIYQTLYTQQLSEIAIKDC